MCQPALLPARSSLSAPTLTANRCASVCIFQRSEEISGQRLWEGSLLLCAYLVEHCSNSNNKKSTDTTTHTGARKFELDLTGKSVLELGAGTGVVSMLAHRLGASPVIMTDGDDK